jgi:outer membrane protein assembly factor BamB
VYALHATTGVLFWKFKTDSRVSSSPAVAGDTVYFGTDRGDVIALHASTGTEQWRFKAAGGVLSSPAIVDGRLYFGSDDRHLYAIE